MTTPPGRFFLAHSTLQRLTGRARRLVRAASGQSGSGLVETAVTLPLYLTIVLVLAQFSIVLLTYCNATYACRLASRYASLHSSSSLAPDTVSQVQTLVTSRLFLSPAIAPTVSVNFYTQNGSSGSNAIGNIVEVAVVWNQTVKVPFLSPISFSIATRNDKVITR